MSVLALLVASVSLAVIGYVIGHRRGYIRGRADARSLAELSRRWGRAGSFD